MLPELALDTPTGNKLPHVWRMPLLRLAGAWLVVVLLTVREWGEMVHQYWNIDTYNHVLLVPAILGWLVWMQRQDLSASTPRAWWPGLLVLAAAIGLWLVGRGTGLNLLSHAGAVGALQACVLTLLGPRIVALLLLPVTYAVFLVPFGDELVPQLQSITAAIAVALTHWSGIPASIEGIYIDTPAGLFIVAEACSGVKFLIAMIALGVLVCFTMFDGWKKRALFLAGAIATSILANGIRAWGTIYIAQYVGAERAGGIDHIIYGWVFFAVIVALVLGVAWRLAEREPEDAGWSGEELARFEWLDRAETFSGIPALVLATLLAIVALAALV